MGNRQRLGHAAGHADREELGVPAREDRALRREENLAIGGEPPDDVLTGMPGQAFRLAALDRHDIDFIQHVAATVKINVWTRHSLIAVSSVRRIGKDHQLGRSFSHHRGSARNVAKLTSGLPHDQARGFAPSVSQAAETDSPGTGCGGIDHIAEHRS